MHRILFFLKAVLQRDTAVKHQMARGGVLVIQAEVALTHELIGSGGFPLFRHGRLGQPLLHLAADKNLEAIRIQIVQEILIRRIRRRVGEQVVSSLSPGVADVLPAG